MTDCLQYSETTGKCGQILTLNNILDVFQETGNLLQSKRDAVTRDPVATSTPVDGSPPTMVHSVGDSPSRMLNRSGISTITASTICDPNFEQDYVAEIKVSFDHL